MTFWRQKTGMKKEVSKDDFFDVFEADPFNFNDELKLEDVLAKPSKTGKLKPSNFSKLDQFSAGPAKSDNVERKKRKYIGYAVFTASLIILVSVLVQTKPWTLWGTSEAVYAYFEVRAVDQSGRPVAGAVVKNAGKKVGTTDSFGEWRRYMKVPLGSTVPITIEKKSAEETQSAIKNFAVPPSKPEKSDLELRASVQLFAGSGIEKTKISNEPATSTVVATNTAATQTLETASDIAKKIEVSSKASQESSTLSFASSHESLWIEAMGSQNSALSREILPAIVQRAKELGLKIEPNAAWKVRLSGLIDKPSKLGKDGGGLILISSFDGENTPPHEFLRNYQSDARLTARGILYVLSRHINKNVALLKNGNRWAAALPKSAPAFWKLAPEMSLVNGSEGNIEVLTSKDVFETAEYTGYYLTGINDSEFVCTSSSTKVCEFTTKSFSQFPPVPTWRKLKLKISAGAKDALKVFVSGYEAKALQDGVFEYWGQDHAKANVTLVQAGHLLNRVQVQNDGKTYPIIAINGASISRR